MQTHDINDDEIHATIAPAALGSVVGIDRSSVRAADNGEAVSRQIEAVGEQIEDCNRTRRGKLPIAFKAGAMDRNRIGVPFDLDGIR